MVVRRRGCDPLAELDFATTIESARRGEEWALTQLYRGIQPRLLGWLCSQAGPRDGEDLASDVWVDVARALPRFKGTEAGFRSFVFTIGWRRLVDHRRRAARQLAEPVGFDRLTAWPGADDPETQVLGTLASDDAIARLTALLTPEQAQVVLLRVVADLPVEDVAAIIGKRPGAVRALQHRALQHLAGRLPSELTCELFAET